MGKALRVLAVFLSVIFIATNIYAIPDNLISGLTSFTPNTVILSGEVNGNYNTIQTAYNIHTHEDITKLGTITTGSWAGSVIPVAYGGTGQNFAASVQGSVIYFDGVGTMKTLAPGSAGNVLTCAGSGANPVWSGGGSASHGVTRGFEASASVGSLYLTVYSGTAFVGDTQANIATTSVLTFANANFWASGSVVSYGGGAGWCAFGIDSGSNLKLLGPAAGNRSDTVGNSSGENLYYWDGTKYWRILGGVRIDTSNSVEASYSQHGNKVMWDVPTLQANASAAGWTDVDCSSKIPPYSQKGIFGLYSAQAGGTSGVSIRPKGTGWTTSSVNSIYESNGGGGSGVGGQRISFTDSSQYIQYMSEAGDTSTQVSVEGFEYNIR